MKAKFAEDDEELLSLSKDFVMVSVSGKDNNAFGVRSTHVRLEGHRFRGRDAQLQQSAL